MFGLLLRLSHWFSGEWISRTWQHILFLGIEGAAGFGTPYPISCSHPSSLRQQPFLTYRK